MCYSLFYINISITYLCLMPSISEGKKKSIRLFSLVTIYADMNLVIFLWYVHMYGDKCRRETAKMRFLLTVQINFTYIWLYTDTNKNNGGKICSMLWRDTTYNWISHLYCAFMVQILWSISTPSVLSLSGWLNRTCMKMHKRILSNEDWIIGSIWLVYRWDVFAEIVKVVFVLC